MMKRLKYIVTVLFGASLAIAGSVYAVQISVPSAPGAGYGLVSNSGGSYNATSTGVVTCSGCSVNSGSYVLGNPLVVTVSAAAFPFTPSSNFGALTNATGTPVWFQAGLQSSSTLQADTIQVKNATATQLEFTSKLWFPGSFNNALVGVVNNVATPTSASCSGSNVLTLVNGTGGSCTAITAGNGISISGLTVTNTVGYPFVGNATSTTLTFSGGLVSNGSTTIAGLASGLVGNFNGNLYGFASSSLFGYIPLNPTRNINTTYPIQGGGDLSADRTLSLAFGTTTGNTWSQLQTLTSGLISQASSTIGSGSQIGGLTVSGGATTTGFITVQGTGTSTFSGGINLNGTDCFAIAGTCLQTFIQNATAYKQAVSYATAAVLAGTPTYNNGSSGVGATLTEVGTGALSVDGQAPSAGQRVLVKNQADQTQNGIYVVTATGSGIASYILTRSTDYNTSNDIYAGTTVPVLVGGTANGDTQWTESTTGTIVVGTSNIAFIETSYGTSGTVTSIATNNGLTGGTITTSGTIGLATINAGVLGAQANGSVPTSQATSTLYGTGTGGQVLTWNNGVPQWVATTTYASGAGISTSFVNGQLTITNTGSTFAYPFPVLGIGTTTGLMITASSTIGNGFDGLTVSGYATTTQGLSVAGDQFRVAAGGTITRLNGNSISITSSAFQMSASASDVLVQNNTNNAASGLKLQGGNGSAATNSAGNHINFFPGANQTASFTGNGLFGFGTTSPYQAIFAINTPGGATGATTTLFMIASSTATATTTLFQIDNVGVASTTGLRVSGISACSGSNALTTDVTGLVSCGAITGSGGSFPFTPTTYGNSTSSVIAFTQGLVSQGSTTIAGLSSGLVGNFNGNLYGFATSSLFGYTPPSNATTLTIAGTANQITSSAGAQDLTANRTWTLSIPALFNIQQASTTILSASNGLYVGTNNTATSTIQGSTVGTSTLKGFLNVEGANSTSTFSGGLAATYLNLTGTSATSTFSGGLRLVGGNISSATMVSCDTIDTDSSGNFKCGTDSDTGAAKLPSWIVKASGGDFTTIQGALDACGGTGGGSIYLLDTTYNQGGTGLVFKGSNCHIYGRSYGTTTINFTGATTGFKTNSAASAYSLNGLHNLRILGAGTAGSIAIDMSDMSHAIYEGIRADNWDTIVRVKDTQNTTFYNKLRDFHFTTIGSFGIDASSTSPANDNTFENGFIGGTGGGAGFFIGINLNNNQANIFNEITVEPTSAVRTQCVQIRSSNLATNNGTFSNEFHNFYCEGNQIGVSASSTDNRGGNAAVFSNNFYGGQIETNTSSKRWESTSGIEMGFFGVGVEFAEFNLFQSLGIATSSPGSIFSIGGVANFTTGTTTFYGNGINIPASKCYAVGGTCLSLSGGAAFAFTPTTYNGVNVNSTTTPLFVTSAATGFGLIASTTLFTNASTTATTSLATIAGQVFIGTTTQSALGNAVVTISNAINGIGGLLITTWTNVTNAFTIKNASGGTVFNVDTTAANPYLGVGTTTPWGTFSAVGNAVDPIFVIASSTNQGLPNFEIDKVGHTMVSGAQPSLSAGTFFNKGNDTAGTIKTASGGATTLTLTFAKTYGNPPICNANFATTTSAIAASSTPTTLVLTFASVNNVVLTYQCLGIQ